MKHSLTLAEKDDLKRICSLLEKYYEIIKILNADSKKSASGGALMYYEVEIKLKEIWT